VAIDADQRAQLLAYRALVIGIAKDGIDIGERSALAAVDQVDRGLFGLMLGALTGSTERKVERQVKTAIKPAVEQLCRRLPAVLASQRQLAASLPAFAPYAELGQDDIGDCERSARSVRDALNHPGRPVIRPVCRISRHPAGPAGLSRGSPCTSSASDRSCCWPSRPPSPALHWPRRNASIPNRASWPSTRPE
jgi:hypothetical protein